MLFKLKQLWLEQWNGCRLTWRRHKWLIFAGLFLTLGFAAVILPFDARLLAWIRQPDNETLTAWARALGKYGDIWPATFCIALILICLDWLFRWPYGRRLALCCLASGLFAGATVNLFRPTLGRPRPKAELPDGLYGPSLEHQFHGFPSGHSGAAFGTASALAFAYPPVAVPVYLGAGAVAWSRMQLNNHHPTDVWVGAMIGVGWGFIFGWGLGQTSQVSGLRPKKRRESVTGSGIP